MPVPVTKLTRLESGSYNPSLDLLVKVAKNLGKVYLVRECGVDL